MVGCSFGSAKAYLTVEKMICKMSAYCMQVICIGPAELGWLVWIMDNPGPVGPCRSTLDCYIRWQRQPKGQKLVFGGQGQ